MTDRKIIETMSQAECEAAEIAMWADMLDMYCEERDAALARAEAAEAERDDANLKALQAEYRVIQLAARVAELEAQIAAQQWRPVTEEPDADDMYPVRVKYRGQVYLDREMRNWNRASGWNDMFAQSKVVEWYPLPPAPQEPTQ